MPAVPTMVVPVVIIGAGAAGLQCAQSLIHEWSYAPEDLLVLEARSRTGGRIYSTRMERSTVKETTGSSTDTTSSSEDTTRPTKEFWMDHGAAWVHGTGFDWGCMQEEEETAIPMPNPMMALLQQTTPSDSNLYDYHLNRVVDGNPWMKPHSVLHKPNALALYVHGTLLSSSIHTSSTNVIQKALERHYHLLQAVNAHGNQLYDQGRGMETIHQSLQQALDRAAADLDKTTAHTTDESTSTTNSRMIPAVARFYQHLLECWYGTNAAELPLYEFAGESDDEDDIENENNNETIDFDTAYTEEGDFYGPHCTLKHGMQAVLEPLLSSSSQSSSSSRQSIDSRTQTIKDRIQLNQPVVRVTRLCNNNGNTPQIQIETATGQIIHTDCCVSTLPIACLQKAVLPTPIVTPGKHDGTTISFHPPLSEPKLEALKTIHMGTYKKVFLTFDRIFWPRETPFVGLVHAHEMPSTSTASTNDKRTDNNPLGECLLLDNLWANQNIPCIEAVLFGKAGRWATHKSLDEIRNAVLDFIAHAMNDDNIPTYCIDCHVTRWEEDPYSGGAYSYMGLGSRNRHVQALREPEWDGHLLFGGEATMTEISGSVHAALLSGKHAAASVHRTLGVQQEPEQQQNPL